MLPFGQTLSGGRTGRARERLSCAEASSVLREAGLRRNRRLSARRQSFSGLEEVYQELDDVYQAHRERESRDRSVTRGSTFSRETSVVRGFESRESSVARDFSWGEREDLTLKSRIENRSQDSEDLRKISRESDHSESGQPIILAAERTGKRKALPDLSDDSGQLQDNLKPDDKEATDNSGQHNTLKDEKEKETESYAEICISNFAEDSKDNCKSTIANINLSGNDNIGDSHDENSITNHLNCINGTLHKEVGVEVYEGESGDNSGENYQNTESTTEFNHERSKEVLDTNIENIITKDIENTAPTENNRTNTFKSEDDNMQQIISDYEWIDISKKNPEDNEEIEDPKQNIVSNDIKSNDAASQIQTENKENMAPENIKEIQSLKESHIAKSESNDPIGYVSIVDRMLHQSQTGKDYQNEDITEEIGSKNSDKNYQEDIDVTNNTINNSDKTETSVVANNDINNDKHKKNRETSVDDNAHLENHNIPEHDSVKIDKEKSKENVCQNYKTNKEEDTSIKDIRTNQVGLKVVMDRILREKSAGREVSVPKELTSHLLNLSSSNISQELQKSCSNIVSRFKGKEDISEKEFLLKRLEELLHQEKKQINSDLNARRKQLKETHESQQADMILLKKKQNKELEELRRINNEENKFVEDEFLDNHEHLRKDIELLENELESMSAPSQLLSAVESTFQQMPGSPRSTSSSYKTEMVADLESDLQCCNCSRICYPPCKIYQCPEGDLLCQSCKELPSLVICPECGDKLKGQVSRNRVLEKIAKKHFSQHC